MRLGDKVFYIRHNYKIEYAELAACAGGIACMIGKYGLQELISENRVYKTLGLAIRAKKKAIRYGECF